jgi:hypothetical protein
VILGDYRDTDASGHAPSRATLSDVFRRALLRRPDAPALIDPPDRAAFTDGAPRELSFAEADRVVSAIAARLRRMGLTTDTIVAIQLPNVAENALTILGVLRAGMIPMPLPLLWRRAEAVAALGRVGAKALITCRRVGDTGQAEIARDIAADTFSIRYVCGFGPDLPDGVVPFDDLFERDEVTPPPALERTGNPAHHVALITWDVTADGLVPVARTHAELLAAGVAILLEGRIDQDACLLGAVMGTSFAGLALTLVPWLLVGGTLALHHPFDAAAFAAQRRRHQPRIVLVPGPLAGRMADAGLLAAGDGLKNVIALWRAPERLPNAAVWRHSDIGLIDVQSFGETGFFPARRGTTGRPAPVRFGMISAPRGAAAALPVIDVMRTEAGTVALRGPMVPHYPFPPDAERSGLPFFETMPGGFADTGYTCRADGDQTMVVTGPPPGLVGIGGYRFSAQALHDAVARAGAASLAPLPDPLSGQRLAGSAADPEALQRALTAIGVNPLLIGAFRGGPSAPPAAAVSAA